MAQPTTKQSSSAKTSDEQKQKNLSKVSYGASAHSKSSFEKLRINIEKI